MRKIRHVLKLAREAGLTQRQIARSLAMSPEKVCDLFRLHALIRKMLARFN
jgi:DNA-binding transcriptional regulator LsrR (DeoR family)